MSDAHLDDLHQQRDEQAARIMDSVKELVGVIVHDVPVFVLREVRRAFVASLVFSEGLDEAAVKALKARAGGVLQYSPSAGRTALAEACGSPSETPE